MKLVTCKPIPPKGRIGAFSPSDMLGGDRPHRVRHGASWLADKGFEVTFAPHAFAVDGIRAGTVAERVDDLSTLLGDDTVAALIATYGGKACNQLIGDLPYDRFVARRRPTLGFSDVAVLQNAVTATTGLVTFYGPNILGKIDQSRWGSLDSLTSGGPRLHTPYVFGDEPTGKATCVRAGRARGRLFGGNLECFVYGNLLSQLDLSFFRGGIFFWESGGLTPREADQALTALANSGFLATISGMVIGDAFVEEGYEWFRSDPLLSVLNATAEFDFPILYYPSFGHKDLENPIIPIGVTANLDAEQLSVLADEDYLDIA